MRQWAVERPVDNSGRSVAGLRRSRHVGAAMQVDQFGVLHRLFIAFLERGEPDTDVVVLDQRPAQEAGPERAGEPGRGQGQSSSDAIGRAIPLGGVDGKARTEEAQRRDIETAVGKADGLAADRRGMPNARSAMPGRAASSAVPTPAMLRAMARLSQNCCPLAA